MKKSPFSTPRGNGPRQSFGRNSAGSPGQGYRRPKLYDFSSPYSRQASQSPGGSDDFIPFDNTSPQPANNRKSNDHWQSPRGQWRSPRGQWTTPRAHREGFGPVSSIPRRHSSSPVYASGGDRRNRGGNTYTHQHTLFYKDLRRKQFNGQQRMIPRRTRPVLSEYMDLESFLEDPWEEMAGNSRDNPLVESPSSSSSGSTSSSGTSSEASVDVSIEEKMEINADDNEPESVSENHAQSDNSGAHTSQEFGDVSGCSKSSMNRAASSGDSSD